MLSLDEIKKRISIFSGGKNHAGALIFSGGKNHSKNQFFLVEKIMREH